MGCNLNVTGMISLHQVGSVACSFVAQRSIQYVCKISFVQSFICVITSDSWIDISLLSDTVDGSGFLLDDDDDDDDTFIVV